MMQSDATPSLFRGGPHRAPVSPDATVTWTPLADDRAFLEAFASPPVSTGITVNEQIALTYAAVFACARVFAEALGMLPWSVHQRIDDTRKPTPDHSAQTFVHDGPNEELSSMDWRDTMQRHAMIYGNGYSEIIRNPVSEAIEQLVVLSPEPRKTKPKRDDAGRLFYEVRGNVGEEPRVIKPINMFHIKGPSPDGSEGFHMVQLMRESIGMGLGTERYGGTFFGNDARPSVAVMAARSMSDTQLKLAIEQLSKAHAGIQKSHKPLYLPEGMTIETLGTSPEQAQFLLTRTFQVQEIARWFNCPLHKLAELTRATFSNIDRLELMFVTDALMPWVMRWEQEANRKLLSRRDRMAGFFTRMNLNARLRGDPKARGEFYRVMTDQGLFSINDVLELEDKDGIGPIGDARLVQINRATIEDVVSGDARGSNEPPPMLPPPDDEDEPDDEGAEALRVIEAHRAAIAQTVERFAAKEAKAVDSRAHKDGFAAWLPGWMAVHATRLAEALGPTVAAIEALTGVAGARREVEAFCVTHFKDAVRRYLLQEFPGQTVEMAAERGAQCDGCVDGLMDVIAGAVEQEEIEHAAKG